MSDVTPAADPAVVVAAEPVTVAAAAATATTTAAAAEAEARVLGARGRPPPNQESPAAQQRKAPVSPVT